MKQLRCLNLVVSWFADIYARAVQFYHISCIANGTKGQSNLALGDIARLIMTSGTAHTTHSYHIRQVAARVAKLVLGMHLEPAFWGRRGRS